jgi:limonene-1,2-epoxide hydrolase
MEKPVSSDAQKIQFIRDMFDAWMRQDWNRATEVFTPDGEMRSMMMDEAWKGHDAIRAMCVDIGKHATNIVLHIKKIGVIDGAVITERLDTFLWDGKKVAYPTVGIFEFEGGKIKLWKEYFDRAHMLKQMGVTQTDY